MAENNRCVICNRSVLRRRQRHVLTLQFIETHRDFVEYILNDVQAQREVVFDGSRSTCHPCWQRFDYIRRQALEAPATARVPAVQVPAVQVPAVQVPVDQVPAPGDEVQVLADHQERPTHSFAVAGFTRAANTSRRCMFDNCVNSELRPVPDSIKAYLLSYYYFYVPELARVCRNHLMNSPWEDFSANATNRQERFVGENLREIVILYTRVIEKKCYIDFEKHHEISANDLHFWTGMNHQQFNEILRETPSLQRLSKCKTILGAYLCKLRSGEPHVRLASMFNVTKITFIRMLKKARRCLGNEFQPKHLGLDHLSRNEIIERNRVIPNYIFGNEEKTKAILICDGTYLFIQKSSNFLFQRLSYSLHKFSNLVKPFMVVCADGYIVDITGPYAARTSDSDIMKLILNNHDGPMEEAPIRWYLNMDDVFILDRGFRDCLGDLEECGYEVHIPPSTARNERQLSTEAANRSRLITMVRWVVETVNGKMKRDFKIFRNRYFNIALKNAMTDFKIAAALVNATQEPYRDSTYTEQFIEMINLNRNRPNLLADFVDRHNLDRQRISFDRLDATNPNFPDFPRMTYDELIVFSIGTYHVKIARSYCSEHVRQTGVFTIEVYRHPQNISLENAEEEMTLMRCRIHSRHVHSRTYYCYILYNLDRIVEYCCSCIHGRRTLGSCAHIISIVYYLAWARYNDNLTQPAEFLDHVLADIVNN